MKFVLISEVGGRRPWKGIERALAVPRTVFRRYEAVFYCM